MGYSNYLQNLITDGLFRGGALNSSGTLNSSAVLTGVWAASTPISAGQVYVPHASMTGAGGKLLLCTTAGTTGTNNALAIPAVGSTLADGAGALVWTVISVAPAFSSLYFALMTIAPTAAGGGTEVSGGSYARVQVACSLANLSATQGGGATAASNATGVGGTTMNIGAITFPAPTASWGAVVALAVYDAATGGNLLMWAPVATPMVVASGGSAPNFQPGGWQSQIQ